MTGLAIVSIVSMLGWLVLMIANYRSFDVPHAKTLRTIAIWVALFAGVAVALRMAGF